MLPAKQGAPFRDQLRSPEQQGKSAQQLICLANESGWRKNEGRIISKTKLEEWMIEPIRIQGITKGKITQIQKSNTIELVLTEHGEIFARGTDSRRDGILGLGKGIFESKEFKQILSLQSKKIVNISLGSTHACAVDDQGVLYSWGKGSNGLLAQLNSSTDSIKEISLSSPSEIIIPDLKGKVKEVICRNNTTNVLTKKGNIIILGKVSNGESAQTDQLNQKKNSQKVQVQYSWSTFMKLCPQEPWGGCALTTKGEIVFYNKFLMTDKLKGKNLIKDIFPSRDKLFALVDEGLLEWDLNQILTNGFFQSKQKQTSLSQGLDCKFYPPKFYEFYPSVRDQKFIVSPDGGSLALCVKNSSDDIFKDKNSKFFRLDNQKGSGDQLRINVSGLNTSYSQQQSKQMNSPTSFLLDKSREQLPLINIISNDNSISQQNILFSPRNPPKSFLDRASQEQAAPIKKTFLSHIPELQPRKPEQIFQSPDLDMSRSRLSGANYEQKITKEFRRVNKEIGWQEQLEKSFDWPGKKVVSEQSQIFEESQLPSRIKTLENLSTQLGGRFRERVSEVQATINRAALEKRINDPQNKSRMDQTEQQYQNQQEKTRQKRKKLIQGGDFDELWKSLKMKPEDGRKKIPQRQAFRNEKDLQYFLQLIQDGVQFDNGDISQLQNMSQRNNKINSFLRAEQPKRNFNDMMLSPKSSFLNDQEQRSRNILDFSSSEGESLLMKSRSNPFFDNFRQLARQNQDLRINFGGQIHVNQYPRRQNGGKGYQQMNQKDYRFDTRGYQPRRLDDSSFMMGSQNNILSESIYKSMKANELHARNKSRNQVERAWYEMNNSREDLNNSLRQNKLSTRSFYTEYRPPIGQSLNQSAIELQRKPGISRNLNKSTLDNPRTYLGGLEEQNERGSSGEADNRKRASKSTSQSKRNQIKVPQGQGINQDKNIIFNTEWDKEEREIEHASPSFAADNNISGDSFTDNKFMLKRGSFGLEGEPNKQWKQNRQEEKDKKSSKCMSTQVLPPELQQQPEDVVVNKEIEIQTDNCQFEEGDQVIKPRKYIEKDNQEDKEKIRKNSIGNQTVLSDKEKEDIEQKQQRKNSIGNQTAFSDEDLEKSRSQINMLEYQLQEKQQENERLKNQMKEQEEKRILKKKLKEEKAKRENNLNANSQTVGPKTPKTNKSDKKTKKEVQESQGNDKNDNIEGKQSKHTDEQSQQQYVNAPLTDGSILDLSCSDVCGKDKHDYDDEEDEGDFDDINPMIMSPERLSSVNNQQEKSRDIMNYHPDFLEDDEEVNQQNNQKSESTQDQNKVDGVQALRNQSSSVSIEKQKESQGKDNLTQEIKDAPIKQQSESTEKAQQNDQQSSQNAAKIKSDKEQSPDNTANIINYKGSEELKLEKKQLEAEPEVLSSKEQGQITKDEKNCPNQQDTEQDKNENVIEGFSNNIQQQSTLKLEDHQSENQTPSSNEQNVVVDELKGEQKRNEDKQLNQQDQNRLEIPTQEEKGQSQMLEDSQRQTTKDNLLEKDSQENVLTFEGQEVQINGNNQEASPKLSKEKQDNDNQQNKPIEEKSNQISGSNNNQIQDGLISQKNTDNQQNINDSYKEDGKASINSNLMTVQVENAKQDQITTESVQNDQNKNQDKIASESIENDQNKDSNKGDIISNQDSNQKFDRSGEVESINNEINDRRNEEVESEGAKRSDLNQEKTQENISSNQDKQEEMEKNISLKNNEPEEIVNNNEPEEIVNNNESEDIVTNNQSENIVANKSQEGNDQQQVTDNDTKENSKDIPKIRDELCNDQTGNQESLSSDSQNQKTQINSTPITEQQDQVRSQDRNPETDCVRKEIEGQSQERTKDVEDNSELEKQVKKQETDIKDINDGSSEIIQEDLPNQIINKQQNQKTETQKQEEPNQIQDSKEKSIAKEHLKTEQSDEGLRDSDKIYNSNRSNQQNDKQQADTQADTSKKQPNSVNSNKDIDELKRQSADSQVIGQEDNTENKRKIELKNEKDIQNTNYSTTIPENKGEQDEEQTDQEKEKSIQNIVEDTHSNQTVNEQGQPQATEERHQNKIQDTPEDKEKNDTLLVKKQSQQLQEQNEKEQDKNISEIDHVNSQPIEQADSIVNSKQEQPLNQEQQLSNFKMAGQMQEQQLAPNEIKEQLTEDQQVNQTQSNQNSSTQPVDNQLEQSSLPLKDNLKQIQQQISQDNIQQPAILDESTSIRQSQNTTVNREKLKTLSPDSDLHDGQTVNKDMTDASSENQKDQNNNQNQGSQIEQTNQREVTKPTGKQNTQPSIPITNDQESLNGVNQEKQELALIKQNEEQQKQQVIITGENEQDQEFIKDSEEKDQQVEDSQKDTDSQELPKQNSAQQINQEQESQEGVNQLRDTLNEDLSLNQKATQLSKQPKDEVKLQKNQSIQNSNLQQTVQEASPSNGYQDTQSRLNKNDTALPNQQINSQAQNKEIIVDSGEIVEEILEGKEQLEDQNEKVQNEIIREGSPISQGNQIQSKRKSDHKEQKEIEVEKDGLNTIEEHFEEADFELECEPVNQQHRDQRERQNQLNMADLSDDDNAIAKQSYDNQEKVIQNNKLKDIEKDEQVQIREILQNEQDNLKENKPIVSQNSLVSRQEQQVTVSKNQNQDSTPQQNSETVNEKANDPTEIIPIEKDTPSIPRDQSTDNKTDVHINPISLPNNSLNENEINHSPSKQQNVLPLNQLKNSQDQEQTQSNTIERQQPQTQQFTKDQENEQSAGLPQINPSKQLSDNQTLLRESQTYQTNSAHQEQQQTIVVPSPDNLSSQLSPQEDSSNQVSNNQTSLRENQTTLKNSSHQEQQQITDISSPDHLNNQISSPKVENQKQSPQKSPKTATIQTPKHTEEVKEGNSIAQTNQNTLMSQPIHLPSLIEEETNLRRRQAANEMRQSLDPAKLNSSQSSFSRNNSSQMNKAALNISSNSQSGTPSKKISRSSSMRYSDICQNFDNQMRKSQFQEQSKPANRTSGLKQSRYGNLDNSSPRISSNLISPSNKKETLFNMLSSNPIQKIEQLNMRNSSDVINHSFEPTDPHFLKSPTSSEDLCTKANESKQNDIGNVRNSNAKNLKQSDAMLFSAATLSPIPSSNKGYFSPHEFLQDAENNYEDSQNFSAFHNNQIASANNDESNRAIKSQEGMIVKINQTPKLNQVNQKQNSQEMRNSQTSQNLKNQQKIVDNNQNDRNDKSDAISNQNEKQNDKNIQEKIKDMEVFQTKEKNGQKESNQSNVTNEPVVKASSEQSSQEPKSVSQPEQENIIISSNQQSIRDKPAEDHEEPQKRVEEPNSTNIAQIQQVSQNISEAQLQGQRYLEQENKQIDQNPSLNQVKQSQEINMSIPKEVIQAEQQKCDTKSIDDQQIVTKPDLKQTDKQVTQDSNQQENINKQNTISKMKISDLQEAQEMRNQQGKINSPLEDQILEQIAKNPESQQQQTSQHDTDILDQKPNAFKTSLTNDSLKDDAKVNSQQSIQQNQEYNQSVTESSELNQQRSSKEKQEDKEQNIIEKQLNKQNNSLDFKAEVAGQLNVEADPAEQINKKNNIKSPDTYDDHFDREYKSDDIIIAGNEFKDQQSHESNKQTDLQTQPLKESITGQIHDNQIEGKNLPEITKSQSTHEATEGQVDTPQEQNEVISQSQLNNEKSTLNKDDHVQKINDETVQENQITQYQKAQENVSHDNIQKKEDEISKDILPLEQPENQKDKDIKKSQIKEQITTNITGNTDSKDNKIKEYVEDKSLTKRNTIEATRLSEQDQQISKADEDNINQQKNVPKSDEKEETTEKSKKPESQSEVQDDQKQPKTENSKINEIKKQELNQETLYLKVTQQSSSSNENSKQSSKENTIEQSLKEDKQLNPQESIELPQQQAKQSEQQDRNYFNQAQNQTQSSEDIPESKNSNNIQNASQLDNQITQQQEQPQGQQQNLLIKQKQERESVSQQLTQDLQLNNAVQQVDVNDQNQEYVNQNDSNSKTSNLSPIQSASIQNQDQLLAQKSNIESSKDDEIQSISAPLNSLALEKKVEFKKTTVNDGQDNQSEINKLDEENVTNQEKESHDEDITEIEFQSIDEVRRFLSLEKNKLPIEDITSGQTNTKASLFAMDPFKTKPIIPKDSNENIEHEEWAKKQNEIQKQLFLQAQNNIKVDQKQDTLKQQGSEDTQRQPKEDQISSQKTQDIIEPNLKNQQKEDKETVIVEHGITINDKDSEEFQSREEEQQQSLSVPASIQLTEETKKQNKEDQLFNGETQLSNSQVSFNNIQKSNDSLGQVVVDNRANQLKNSNEIEKVQLIEKKLSFSEFKAQQENKKKEKVAQLQEKQQTEEDILDINQQSKDNQLQDQQISDPNRIEKQQNNTSNNIIPLRTSQLQVAQQQVEQLDQQHDNKIDSNTSPSSSIQDNELKKEEQAQEFIEEKQNQDTNPKITLLKASQEGNLKNSIKNDIPRPQNISKQQALEKQGRYYLGRESGSFSQRENKQQSQKKDDTLGSDQQLLNDLNNSISDSVKGRQHTSSFGQGNSGRKGKTVHQAYEERNEHHSTSYHSLHFAKNDDSEDSNIHNYSSFKPFFDRNAANEEGVMNVLATPDEKAANTSAFQNSYYSSSFDVSGIPRHIKNVSLDPEERNRQQAIAEMCKRELAGLMSYPGEIKQEENVDNNQKQIKPAIDVIKKISDNSKVCVVMAMKAEKFELKRQFQAFHKLKLYCGIKKQPANQNQDAIPANILRFKGNQLRRSIENLMKRFTKKMYLEFMVEIRKNNLIAKAIQQQQSATKIQASLDAPLQVTQKQQLTANSQQSSRIAPQSTQIAHALHYFERTFNILCLRRKQKAFDQINFSNTTLRPTIDNNSYLFEQRALTQERESLANDKNLQTPEKKVTKRPSQLKQVASDSPQRLADIQQKARSSQQMEQKLRESLSQDVNKNVQAQNRLIGYNELVTELEKHLDTHGDRITEEDNCEKPQFIAAYADPKEFEPDQYQRLSKNLNQEEQQMIQELQHLQKMQHTQNSNQNPSYQTNLKTSPQIQRGGTLGVGQTGSGSKDSLEFEKYLSQFNLNMSASQPQFTNSQLQLSQQYHSQKQQMQHQKVKGVNSMQQNVNMVGSEGDAEQEGDYHQLLNQMQEGPLRHGYSMGHESEIQHHFQNSFAQPSTEYLSKIMNQSQQYALIPERLQPGHVYKEKNKLLKVAPIVNYSDITQGVVKNKKLNEKSLQNPPSQSLPVYDRVINSQKQYLSKQFKNLQQKLTCSTIITSPNVSSVQSPPLNSPLTSPSRNLTVSNSMYNVHNVSASLHISPRASIAMNASNRLYDDAIQKNKAQTSRNKSQQQVIPAKSSRQASQQPNSNFQSPQSVMKRSAQLN